MNNLQTIIKQLGFAEIGRACGVERQAVYQWYKKGRLPKTERLPHTNERRTTYAIIIAYMAGITTDDLLKSGLPEKEKA